MREMLKQLYGHKRKYKAEFVRFGTREDDKKPSMLLKNVIDNNGNIVAGHVWLQKVPENVGTNLFEGDFIEFVAVVHRYQKRDYGLTLISDVTRL